MGRHSQATQLMKGTAPTIHELAIVGQRIGSAQGQQQKETNVGPVGPTAHAARIAAGGHGFLPTGLIQG
jgi:hypothetical protein